MMYLSYRDSNFEELFPKANDFVHAYGRYICLIRPVLVEVSFTVLKEEIVSFPCVMVWGSDTFAVIVCETPQISDYGHVDV
jgi:hypothetical protein